MKYFVLRGASQRTKLVTSFALALFMVFQALGPGVFAVKTARAIGNVGNSATVVATKIVCTNESDLPNWGNGSHSSIGISSTTATDWVAAHPSCHLQSGWQFQYGNSSATDAGNTFTGPASNPWTTFTNQTGSNGVTSQSIDLANIGSTLWMREVLQTGYIPFTYDSASSTPNGNTFSAEMYCNHDVLNYDNFENISSPSAGSTYYCVAWNVAVAVPCITPVTVIPGDKITSFGASSGPELTLQQVLDAAYSPAGTINATTSETGIAAWTIPVGTNSVTFSGKYIRSIAGNTEALGYYFDGNLSTFTPIFKNNASNSVVAPVLAEGSAIPSFTVTTTGHTTIAFAVSTEPQSPAKYGTEKSVNAGEDHAVVYNNPNNAKGYVIAFEDLPFSVSDKDYQDLVVELNVDSCTHGGNQCVPSSGSIVSDTTTQETSPATHATVPVGTPYNSRWTATIPGATWIWGENPIADAVNQTSETFTRTFTITGTPTSASLDVATDNGYTVSVNGHAEGGDPTEFNYQAVADDSSTNPDHYTIPAGDLVTGTNTVVFTVTNFAQVGGTPATNPGGLLYKLTWNSDCGNNGGGGNPGTSLVHVEKYVDGNPANFTGGGAPSFPIHVDLGSGSADTFLNSTLGYSWTSGPVTNNSNTINVHEKTTTDGDPQSIVVSSADSCSPGKYYLNGYSSSDVDFATAASQATTSTYGPVQGISHDKYIVIHNNTCPTTAHIVATKIVCTNEADLPNFGDGNGPAITASTAANWISSAHPSCSLQPDWTFQWAPSGTSNPGDNSGSAAPSPWSSEGPTIAGGTISFDVPAANNGGYVWMREVLKSGYIPFSGWLSNGSSTPSTVDKFSAELYCSTDHLNYDNYDRVDNLVAGQTYNCVAWNVPTTPPVPVGTIKITKYECPAGTEINRANNGPSATDINANTYTIPNGCVPEAGATFGYTYDANHSDNSTGPFLGLSPDTTPFTPFSLTGAHGTTTLDHASTTGRYVVVELDSAGHQLPAGNMLGLYCYGDGDTTGANDNQEVTFSVDGKVSNCVAYNKMGTLTIIKHVINGKPGFTLQASDFSLDVTGNHPSQTPVIGAEAPGTTINIGHGSYAVTEVDSKGYTISYSQECSGIMTAGGSATCTVTNTDDPTPGGPFTLTVTINGDGTGSVLGDQVANNIDCSDIPGTENQSCVETYPSGTVVNLTETPGEGSNFDGTWSGACSGNGACQVTMNIDQAVNAHFGLNSTTPPGGSGGGGGGGGGGCGPLGCVPSSGLGGGVVAGASTGNGGQVLGATTDVPGLPNTGDGQGSQTLMITLTLIAALVGLNIFAIRGVTRKNSR